MEVLDDESSDSRTGDVLTVLERQGVQVFRLKADNIDPVARLGWMRRQAVDRFLANHKAGDFLVLLDDDVLTDGDTLADSIADYILLQEAKASPGSLTLFGWLTLLSELELEKRVFGKLRITGDAHWIVDRETLKFIGRFFGYHIGGFADLPLLSLAKLGKFYYTRLVPLYNVQHLGFGSQTSAVGRPDTTEWTRRPYAIERESNRWLHVPGFDLHRYVDAARLLGNDKAAWQYAEKEGL